VTALEALTHIVSTAGDQQSKHMRIAITASKQRAAFMHGETVHIERREVISALAVI
jgi:hypothetical protein